METTSAEVRVWLWMLLQSNHSGMETWGKGRVSGTAVPLQSNHSGMETNLQFGGGSLNPSRCSRTIVGWRPSLMDGSILLSEVLQSNHSGMETVPEEELPPPDTKVAVEP